MPIAGAGGCDDIAVSSRTEQARSNATQKLKQLFSDHKPSSVLTPAKNKRAARKAALVVIADGFAIRILLGRLK